MSDFETDIKHGGSSLIGDSIILHDTLQRTFHAHWIGTPSLNAHVCFYFHSIIISSQATLYFGSVVHNGTWRVRGLTSSLV